MLVYQRVKQFHKPVFYHCTMIIPLCVYIYTINVVKTMPCLPSPSYHHFYRWYVETIRSLRGGHVQKRCRLSKAGDDLAGHGKPAPVPGGWKPRKKTMENWGKRWTMWEKTQKTEEHEETCYLKQEKYGEFHGTPDELNCSWWEW